MHNRLLRLLPPDDFALLSAHLEPVVFPKAAKLIEPNTPFEHAFFFASGLGSIITSSPEGLEAESGVFGRDGFAPADLALGDDRALNRVVVQIAGEGHRMPAGALRDAAAASPVLRVLLLRYVRALSAQTHYTALSNAVHPVDERLARWLLMCHDRIDGDEVPLTHEFLSLMLAVRRPSVTTALHVLERNRFITAARGHIVIRDRARLEEFAADSYGRPEAEYARLIGPM